MPKPNRINATPESTTDSDPVVAMAAGVSVAEDVWTFGAAVCVAPATSLAETVSNVSGAAA